MTKDISIGGLCVDAAAPLSQPRSSELVGGEVHESGTRERRVEGVV